jgi:hypothetical protein
MIPLTRLAGRRNAAPWDAYVKFPVIVQIRRGRLGVHSANGESFAQARLIGISRLATGLIVAAGILALSGSGKANPIAPSVLGADQPSLCDAIAENLVVNCGFETGDFTGWDTTPAETHSLFGVNGNPHTGDNAAFFGATAPPFADSISQLVPTIPGETYNLAFWLANEGGPENQFVATFGDITLSSLTDVPAFPYTEFVNDIVAFSDFTLLTFSAYQVPSFFTLDDISVLEAIPEPAPLGLLGGAILATAIVLRQRKRLSPPMPAFSRMSR